MNQSTTMSDNHSNSNKAEKGAVSLGRRRMIDEIKETCDFHSTTGMSDNNNNNEERPDGIPAAKNVGRKRMIDETKLAPDEARKLELRRAYNRQSAAQARHRNKELISSLQAKIEQLTKENASFRGTVERMGTQLDELVHQNRILVLQQELMQQQNAATRGTFPSSNFGGNGGLLLPAGAANARGNSGTGSSSSLLSINDILTLLLRQQQQPPVSPTPAANPDLALFAAATTGLFLPMHQRQNCFGNGTVVSGTNATTDTTASNTSQASISTSTTNTARSSSDATDADGGGGSSHGFS